MYSITAVVDNLFSISATEKYAESHKLQLIGETYLKDGQIKKALVDLTVPEELYKLLQPYRGLEISLPISFFQGKNGQQIPFIPKFEGQDWSSILDTSK